MPIGINGSGTITGVSVGGLPDSIITSAELATDSVTTAAITNANVTPAKLAQPFTASASQNANGLTNVDFTGIPSWVSFITIGFYGIATSGNNAVGIRIGTGGTPETTGYLSTGMNIAAGGNPTGSQVTTYFAIDNAANSAAARSGTATLALVDSNTWGMSSLLARTDSVVASTGGGRLILSGSLDIVRFFVAAGTFTNGYVRIMYQG